MAFSEPEDIRITHIQRTLQQILNYDTKMWEDAIWKEENQSVIKDFLDNPSTTIIFIFCNQDEQIIFSADFPNARIYSNRLCFFLKKNATVSTVDHKKEISFGSITCPQLLIQYQNIFEKVLAPIFCNTRNYIRWPLEISQDVSKYYQDFLMNLSHHIGLAEERTILWIPELAKKIDTFNVDELTERSTQNTEEQKILDSVTDMLSKWHPIVRQILEHTPEDIVAKMNQVPLTEISFWENRRDNLEFIFSQMNEPIVEKMILALEKLKYSYFKKFKSLLQEVAEKLDEARDICLNFDLMLDTLKELETCSMEDLNIMLPNAVKAITASWIGSKYYSSLPSRITVLIKKFCFFITDKIQNFLRPSTLFKSDRKEGQENLKLSKNVVKTFLQSYRVSRDELQNLSENKLYPWVYPDERVFSQFEEFVDRLDQIEEIFLAADVYFSIALYNLSSIQLSNYNRRLKDLYSTFSEAYSVFENCCYDPLDVHSSAFIEDYRKFIALLNDLDHKLGRIIGQACLDCVPPEDGFKLLDMLQELLKRPKVESEMKKLVSLHVKIIYEDLLNARDIYDEINQYIGNPNEVLVYKNISSVSGSIQWIHDLRRKIESSVSALKAKTQYVSTSGPYEFILKIHDDMSELLDKREKDVIDEWGKNLEEIKFLLDDVLLITDKDGLPRLNFKPRVFEMTIEIQYLKKIEKAKLLSDEEFVWITNTFVPAQSLLASCIRWYCDINKNIVEHEQKLISSQWKQINSCVDEGYLKKWTAYDILEFAEKMYSLTQKLHEQIHQAKLNVSEIENFIETWESTPLFTRDDSDHLLHLEISENDEFEKQKDAVHKTAELIKEIAEKNRGIFESDSLSKEWKDYLSYLETLLENGIKNAIKSSLQYLHENTNSFNKKLLPFYKIELHLEKDVVFKPSLDEKEAGNFTELFENIIKRIFSLASEVKKLSDPDTDYHEAVAQDEELKSLVNSLILNLKQSIIKMMSTVEEFDRYADLWLKDINEVLEDFILHGPVPEVEVIMEEDLGERYPDASELEIKPPTEEEFKNEIADFDEIYKRVDDTENTITIESWLVLDITSFKNSLLQILKKWQLMYEKKFLEMKQLGQLRKIEEEE